MGIKWTSLSDAQRALCNQADIPLELRRLDSGASGVKSKGMTAAGGVVRLERVEHGVFENWLLLHGYSYRHSRTDKPTRERIGAPDFTVYEKPKAGVAPGIVCRCLAFEFKVAGNKLSKAQEEWAARYGGTMLVVATAEEAIAIVKRIFDE